MHHKSFGDRAPPGSAEGAYNAPPDPLAGLVGPREGGGKEEGKTLKGGENEEKWKGMRGKKEGKGGPAP